MAKNSYTDWDATAGNNSDVGGINIAENCAAANINNAIREMMGQLASYTLVSTTASQTLTNKTLTAPQIYSGVANDGLLIKATSGLAYDRITIDDGKIQWGSVPTEWLIWVDNEGLEGYENSSRAFRIGSNETTQIPSVYNNTTANAANVFVGSQGNILRSTSTGEFKTERQSVDPDVVLRLNPVSFKSTHEEDEGRRLAGFIAEEVAETFPEASADGGKNYDVRAIVAALVAKAQEQERRLNAIEEGL